DHAIESIRPLIEGLDQRLDLRRSDPSVRLDGDPVRLAQVFSNLLDNASKYSPPGSRIEVAIERSGDDVVVSIGDDGAGITPEHLPHLFDLFYQVDRSLGRTHQGLGIGLTLVKRLVE